MSQSQKTKYSLSLPDYSYKLKTLDGSLNLSEQENAVENNMLSTATDALNQEDSTEFTNGKVIYTHHQTSVVLKPKYTEHRKGEIAHEKQSAVCRTDNYTGTSQTSLIAQRKFQNNIIGLNPPDIQQVQRLKFNYSKFCPVITSNQYYRVQTAEHTHEFKIRTIDGILISIDRRQ
ncbi:MAG: hypothetical protein EZS28_021539 [Streblomastix strix]|uniref:Uncharacterized protein n=1 Tax=Streblomastix strix TaxID=222440 RepID=A0A5J4VK92_9EUKA|nr:MAG: hypothetical protein EZS28_021539 [Streblomastix strix]